MVAMIANEDIFELGLVFSKVIVKYIEDSAVDSINVSQSNRNFVMTRLPKYSGAG